MSIFTFSDISVTFSDITASVYPLINFLRVNSLCVNSRVGKNPDLIKGNGLAQAELLAGVARGMLSSGKEKQK